MTSDLNLLPPPLAARSASKTEIVLRYKDAVQALEHLTAMGVPILGWEGWLVFMDGRVAHSMRHQGTADIEGLAPDRVLAVCKATMGGDHMMYEANHEAPDAELQFCIVVAAP